ncbi:TonB-dependent hemoglobin/transferrin/lactoferrin family receptor [Stakelama tenebrarum]|uniref:TonB-dependent hemoglobin/transferrin/lactoferrin family receptor n=1 Tax=Stakelama tenebrarum TaxID=2711215 RepID=A0A6G6YA07_9SPHN|nr:TonB-dependent hemoglobin/transferrin/lactoferrin family receptor [Sphingosinithalassobacter tenebrarum]QIG81647.1 TonB-dependent hemoglobin/transferrin/lactoferrin family receptor [Sphingosinithalassobacter tenebrarum]
MFKRPTAIAIGCSLIALTAAMPSQAQTQSQERAEARQDSAASSPAQPPITVIATRMAIAADEAPATVTVIDARQMADELVTDIRDLVRFEPGITVPRQPARFGAALGTTGRAGNEGFTVRGIGGNRVLIQVDGVRVPDGFTFGAQSAGRGDYVDLGLIKSVEFLRGPASALYGSDGLSGVVSFTTSDPEDLIDPGNDFGGLVRAGYHSADQEFSETAILAGRTGDWSAMLAYTRRDFQEMENQGDVGGTGSSRTEPNPQDGNSNALLGRIVYSHGSHRLRLTGEYIDTYLYTDVLSGLGDNGMGASVDNLVGRDTGERKRVAFDWSWQGSGTIDHARLSAYWQDSEDRQFTVEDRTPSADRERLNTFENRVWGLSGETGAAFDTGPLSHRLLLGGDISFTRQEGLRDGTVPPFGETFPTRAFPATDYMLAGIYLADEIEVGPVTFYPALRADWYDLDPTDDPLLPSFAGAAQHGSRVSPKIGAVLRLGEGVRLFGNYAQGFKAPEPGQVNQFFGNLAYGYISEPNPDLGPETSESYEAGIRLTGDNFRVEATAFHADYDDFISQEVVGGSFTPSDPAIYQFINLDRAEVEGVEGKFEAWTDSGFNGRMAIAYAKGDVIDPSGARTPLSSVDPLTLVLGGGYRDPAGRFGGQVVMTHGARKEADATTGLCSGDCFRPDAYTILDITAFARLGHGFTLRGGLFNVTDETYATWNDVRGLAASSSVTDAYTRPGRNGSVSLSYRF